MINNTEIVKEINEHRKDVEDLMKLFALVIYKRGENHDRTKLEEPEFSALTLIKNMKFGSDEYIKHCKTEGIQAHYKNNRHHPEHFENGISGMDLIDLIEYFVDCFQAAKRRSGTNPDLDFLARRHKIEPQLLSILKNTIHLCLEIKEAN